MNALKIKYEDSEMILVEKPVGVAVESRRIGEKDMLSIMKTYRVEQGESDYVGMIHRLDQPVGGLLLFAKTKEAAVKISKQLQDGTMEKYYQALLHGRIEEKGELTDYLLRDGRTNISRVVEKGTPGAKMANLSFRRLKVFSRISLVEIKLATGRHHQIRVQMAHHGFPLLGDRKYSLEHPFAFSQCEAHTDAGRPLGHISSYPEGAFLPQEKVHFNGEKFQGPALFAWRLKFRHPKTGKWMDFTEKPPWKLE